MELEKIRELVDMMKANDLTELEIVDGQSRIVLKRGPESSVPQVVTMTPALAMNGSIPVATKGIDSANNTESQNATGQNEQDGVEIVAPIVGTFYTAPSPNADHFVEVGSKIDEDMVVCIIEAMKVMNEVKSEIKGTIKRILVSSGAAVEYGQPLFLVEPE